MQGIISQKGISAIGAAYLTEVVDISFPTVAFAGDPIGIEVRVKNVSTESLAIGATGVVEGIESGNLSPLVCDPTYIWLEPGETDSFTTSFIMPNEDVGLWVVSWYWVETEWIQDNFGYFEIPLTEVAAYLTEIVDIIAPASACAGDQVNVEVKVKNSSTEAIYITASGRYDNIALYFSPDYFLADPGSTKSFTVSFTMPNEDVRVPVWSGYWTGTEWVLDATDYVDIALTEIPSEYMGTISKKQLTYDSIVGLIPVAAKVSQGTRGIVTVLGRNDMATKQQMGIAWRVKDPDGYEVEHYSAWEAWPYCPPGDEHKFDGGRFDIDKPGDWTINIGLYMNHDNPVLVDSYVGVLCQVEAIEYAGTITEVWINKAPEGTGLSPDTAVVADGNTFEVGTRARNDSSVTFTGTVQVVVYDPDHVKRADKSDSTGIDPGENLYFGEGLGATFNICSVDKAGDWIIVVVFRGDEMTLDHKEYTMTAVPALPDSEFQNFAITGYDSVPVDEQLMVNPGQTATVHMTVDYRGKAIDGSIYTAMGWQVGIVIPEFYETFNSLTPVHFDASYDFTTYEFDCDVDILTLRPAEELLYGTLLDMYAKIVGVPGPDIYTPFYTGVIAWGKPIEEYELIQHTVSHFAYIYDGDNETTIVTLKTDPFKPADWVPEKFISELEREARESGVRVLETKVYVDTSPLFWTDYRIEVTSTPSGEVTGVGVGIHIPGIIVNIILFALAIAFGIFVISWAVKQFLGVFERKVGLEDMKPTWGKEALILDIKDTEGWLKKEGRLEQPVTPAETLEGMSEAELREHLDKLGEKVVPPGLEIPWALVAVGGLGVLGVGAAVALAARRKE